MSGYIILSVLTLSRFGFLLGSSELKVTTQNIANLLLSIIYLIVITVVWAVFSHIFNRKKG